MADEIKQPTCKRCEELCEELSVQVSDHIDPSVNVPWMRGSPGLPQYIFDLELSEAGWCRAASMLRTSMGLVDGTDLSECLENFLKEKICAERAEKACAEMRALIADKLKPCWDNSIEFTRCPVCKSLCDEDGHLKNCGYVKAMSTDCGSGYVRREELEAAKSRLSKLDAYLDENESVQGFILDVLEQLEKRGVDTTNWDGDESSATIMASCIAGKIREKQEELDAAKAEVGRLSKVRKAYEYAIHEIYDWVKSAEKEWSESVDMNVPKNLCDEAMREAKQALGKEVAQ